MRRCARARRFAPGVSMSLQARWPDRQRGSSPATSSMSRRDYPGWVLSPPARWREHARAPDPRSQRSSRGGVTAPETISLWPFEEILIVELPVEQYEKTRRWLAAAARSPAPLGIVSRCRRNVAHIDDVQLPMSTPSSIVGEQYSTRQFCLGGTVCFTSILRSSGTCAVCSRASRPTADWQPAGRSPRRRGWSGRRSLGMLGDPYRIVECLGPVACVPEECRGGKLISR